VSSTGGQFVQRQVDELRKACCAEIVKETACASACLNAD